MHRSIAAGRGPASDGRPLSATASVPNLERVRAAVARPVASINGSLGAYLVKVSRDDGATWGVVGVYGHRSENSPMDTKNTYDFLVDQGYGKPVTRPSAVQRLRDRHDTGNRGRVGPADGPDGIVWREQPRI